MMKFANMAKTDYQKAGFAYSLSKNFVVWYAQKCAFEYGTRGIRVASLSPGLIATDMGKLEEKEGSALLPYTAEGRMGKGLTGKEVNYECDRNQRVEKILSRPACTGLKKANLV